MFSKITKASLLLAVCFVLPAVHGRSLFTKVDECSGDLVGKCCSTTGECPSSSCVDNGLAKNDKDANCNSQKCPLQLCDKSPFNPSCSGGNSHCLGQVTCADGSSTCPSYGNICFYDGNSNNFKICTPDVDCQVSDWSDWSTCVCGKQTRTRTITTDPSGNGATCPPLTETQDCPQDCELTPWADWSACQNNARKRTRFVLQPALNGGAACGPLTETQPCDGCGPELTVVQCKLDKTKPVTVCQLPAGLGTMTVDSMVGQPYTRARIRINGKVTFKA
jgi:hypothetical protein